MMLSSPAIEDNLVLTQSGKLILRDLYKEYPEHFKETNEDLAI
jgi:hypothetical protein